MRVSLIISKHGLNPVCLVLIFSLVGAGAQCDTWQAGTGNIIVTKYGESRY